MAVSYCIKLPHVSNTHILRSVKEHKGVLINRYLHVTVLLGDNWMETETPFDTMLVIV